MKKEEQQLGQVERALEALKQGRAIVVVDDLTRENEGDLVIAAQLATKETINFMIQEGRGLICLSLDQPLVNRLQLKMQTEHNTSPLGTNFTESISLVGQGASALSSAGRTATILRAVSEDARPEEFERPGFVFPLAAKAGGVLRRRGQTEASVDLARLAGLQPAGVICEIMASDGEMLRGDALERFCSQHDLPLISVQDVVDYRLRNEVFLRRIAASEIEDLNCILSEDLAYDQQSSQYQGPFKLFVYFDDVDEKEQICLVIGYPVELRGMQAKLDSGFENVLVRIHSECLTGDIFGSKRCDCGEQLRIALRQMCAEGRGILVYLFQEGRGIGLNNKLRAYHLQDHGLDTVDANIQLGFPPDMRDYRAAVHILRDLGVSSVRLMTNNPEKVQALQSLGIKVTERVSVVADSTSENSAYLKAKRNRMGHILPEA